MNTVDEIARRVSGGKSTATIEVQSALEKAKNVEQKNIFIALTSDRALAQAHEIDQKIANGEYAGKLAGVPFAVKDNFLTFGAPTTAASKMLMNFNAPLQATAIEKLEAEGAICIGKTNLDSFAHGGSTENSAFGPTKNAYDDTKVAGGSSGGSAVAVALDVVPFTIGSDTGGSIRQPASFNGVYGIKPTYGTVSRYGVVAMASSTDTVGCFTQNAKDMTIIMEIISGRDMRDMTTLPDFFVHSRIDKKMKVGVITDFMSDAIDKEVRAKTNEYRKKLELAGHDVVEVNMPILKHALAMYYIIVPAEISSNLARYDGVRYGLRARNPANLAELYGKSRQMGFESENERRIMIGSYVLSSGYFDAYYQKAQKARTLLIAAYEKLFKDCDVLLSPVSPTAAFALGKKTENPVEMYLADVLTVPASLAGIPALSIPAGNNSDGQPIGIQLTGPRQSDATLLALAQSMEDFNG